MRLGIGTRWQRHEATYGALRIAEWGLRRAHEVSLFALAQRATRSHIQLPDGVGWSEGHHFTDWVCSFRPDALVWAGIPGEELMQWCRESGLPVYLWPLWHEVDAEDRPSLSAAKCVVAPCREAAQQYRSWGASRVAVIPQDAGGPLWSRADDPWVTPSFVLPLWDGLVRRTEMTIWGIMDRAMASCDRLQLTIASTNTLGGPSQAAAGRLSRAYRGRVTWRRAPIHGQRAGILANHDLAICPYEWESTGLTAAMAAAVGVPSIAFAVPPVTSLLADDAAVLVSAGLLDTDGGAPRICRDTAYQRFEQLVMELLRHPAHLLELRRVVPRLAAHLRAAYDQSLANLLEG